MAYRIYNTWMGDPAKVLQLEEVIGVIRDDKLIDNAAEVRPLHEGRGVGWSFSGSGRRFPTRLLYLT